MALELAAFGGPPKPSRIVVLPIRQEIDDALLYTVRRGVKQAMQTHADVLVLDMDTNGGALDSMLKIIEVSLEFKGRTVTYVNKDAFSAGALIAISVGEIYMAPESVIGAAAPVMLSPEGAGTVSMPDTVERKTTSAISAKIRAYSRRQGHNPDVADSMIDKAKELRVDGQTLKKEGGLLTLTNQEAEQEYGNPPKPLLSSGTVENLPSLLLRLGSEGGSVTRVEATGAEQLAGWILRIRPLLLIVGILGIYLEFKMPGVTLPGVVGGVALVIYFFGGYVAGISGLEWLALFIVGVALLAVEVFVTPGGMAAGIAGMAAMFAALVMAMVDIYPGGPLLPSAAQLRLPLRDLSMALAGALACVAALARFVPKTRLYAGMIPHTASGTKSPEIEETRQSRFHGCEGEAVSPLRPGGKARFGDETVDVISDGEMIEPGVRVRVIGASGNYPVVQPLNRIKSKAD